MIETASQRAKREKAESAERAARAQRHAAKMNGATTPVAAAGPMTRVEAEAITNRIVNAAEELGALLLEAHRREAWKALGFDSWRAYATAKFKFSQRHAYRLLDHAAVLEAICPIGQNEISPIGEKPSEAVTRPLKALPDAEKKEAWQTAVTSAPNGKPTAKAVAAAVSRVNSGSKKTHFQRAATHPLLANMKRMWKRMPLEAQELFREWIADGTK